jgi:hypothetical protein
MRNSSIVSLVLLAAVALSACGGGGKDQSKEFAKTYKPVNASFIKAGPGVAAVVTAASGNGKKSKAQYGKISTKAENSAEALLTVKNQLLDLKPPTDNQVDMTEFEGDITDASDTLKQISAEAAAFDQKAIKASIKKLIQQANALNTVQNKLAAATGAARGGR